MREFRRREKITRDRIKLVREGEEASDMRRATRRQSGAVRQGERYNREGMRRKEGLQARKIDHLKKQACATRVGYERGRWQESRDNSRASESS